MVFFAVRDRFLKKSMKQIFFLWAVIVMSAGFYLNAEGQSSDVLTNHATLESCIHYALSHQPALQQSYLDQQITEHSVKSKLADWFPQVGLSYNLNHYIELPTSSVSNSNGSKQPVKTGLINNSTINLGVNQTIFNDDVLLAARSAKDVRREAGQNVVGTKINTIVDVTKAYYDVLISQRQLDILQQDIVRLRKSEHDAYIQYKAGIVDQTDYERASIALNNSLAALKTTREQVKGKYAFLKQLMGYPSDNVLALSYDTTQMGNDVRLDTTQVVNYKNRIEYQALQTQKRLQIDNLDYYKLSFLPTLSVFYNYNLAYLNNDFNKLYNTSYPNSLIGLQVTLPLFEGTKRIQNIKVAKLELERSDWDITAIKFQINTQFVQAMSAYKSNLNYWRILKKNVQTAQNVYNVISLQYKQGVKTYLDVITAESDLRTAEFNYLDALFNVLSSKVDVEKAMGKIPLNQ